MSKFISSSLWNFSANFIVRVLSIITFPFLVNFFLKEDISIYKTFQSFALILLTILPLGTNILYLSEEKEKREERWNLLLYVTLIASGLLSFLFIFSDTVVSFFVSSIVSAEIRVIIIAMPLLEGLKALCITKLSSSLEFKAISIALIVKQFVLYAGIIILAVSYPVLSIILLLIFVSEAIELFVLFIFALKRRIALLPNLPLIKINFDKTAKKFIFFSGFEQIFLNFAMQYPTIWVVIVLGKTIAPEFQLPFTAVAMPVSLVINSVAWVSFPYYSNLREDVKIANSLFSVLFSLTFILFPMLCGIHFFAKEITSIFFDKEWTYAIFAISGFALLMAFYIIGVPSTYISNIKKKPYINLIYSACLLVSRLTTIYLGNRFYGFYGAIIFFVGGDIILRLIRLSIDLRLLGVSLFRFWACIKHNVISSLILLGSMWLIYYFTEWKVVGFLIALTLSLGYNYLMEKKQWKELYNKLSLQLTRK